MSDQDHSRSLAQDFLEAYEANPREEVARALAEQREGIAKAIEAVEAGESWAAFQTAARLAREFRLEVES